ncbi:hypothetical protein Tco_1061891 [Tanacetum coccineum]
MYTFSPMMVANSQKHHCRVCPYTQEVLVLSINLEIQTKHYPLIFRNHRGNEARIKKTTLKPLPKIDPKDKGKKKIEEEEREMYTIEQRAKLLHDTIAAQRRFLAQQRSKAIINKPPSRNQLRN